jgi:hypothetical protein
MAGTVWLWRSGKDEGMKSPNAPDRPCLGMGKHVNSQRDVFPGPRYEMDGDSPSAAVAETLPQVSGSDHLRGVSIPEFRYTPVGGLDPH